MTVIDKSQVDELLLEMSNTVHPYTKAIFNDDKIQVGTGFLIRFAGKTCLITSKYVVMDQENFTNPFKPYILLSGLTQFTDLEKAIIMVADNADLAIVSSPSFDNHKALPDICFSLPNPKDAVAIIGYVARDSRRMKVKPTVDPAPYLHAGSVSNVALTPSGIFTIKYYRKISKRNIDQLTIPTKPRGLSGGPVVALSNYIINGSINVLGVFTECDRGREDATNTAQAENSMNLLYLLNAVSKCEHNVKPESNYHTVTIPDNVHLLESNEIKKLA